MNSCKSIDFIFTINRLKGFKCRVNWNLIWRLKLSSETSRVKAREAERKGSRGGGDPEAGPGSQNGGSHTETDEQGEALSKVQSLKTSDRTRWAVGLNWVCNYWWCDAAVQYSVGRSLEVWRFRLFWGWLGPLRCSHDKSIACKNTPPLILCEMVCYKWHYGGCHADIIS